MNSKCWHFSPLPFEVEGERKREREMATKGQNKRDRVRGRDFQEICVATCYRSIYEMITFYILFISFALAVGCCCCSLRTSLWKHLSMNRIQTSIDIDSLDEYILCFFGTFFFVVFFNGEDSFSVSEISTKSRQLLH